jgi:tetratricopeptide (TPR) repeat protein
MDHYRYSKYHYRPHRRKRKLFISLLILILIGGGVFFSVFFLNVYTLYAHMVDLYRIWFNDYSFLEKNIDSGNYNVAIHEGTPYLERRPYNPRLLRYIGESYYYISTSMTGNEKEESLTSAIRYLRKSIVLSPFNDVLTKAYYILGMSYFRKGISYYELAAEYLRHSLELGYNDNSVYEILGYCYYKIGALDEAVTFLEKAKTEAPRDIVLLYLAFAYKDKEMYGTAVKELNYLIDNSRDDAIYEEAFSALIWIDFHEERFDVAKKNILSILEVNENSAFAHFWLGNVHETEGDLISARKEWRKTLKIDPKHIGAIEKLY